MRKRGGLHAKSLEMSNLVIPTSKYQQSKIFITISLRSDLYSNVTCEASNYNGSVMQKTITIDMNFLPTRISVTERGAPLLAGTAKTFTCTAYDSRPPALITWELDHKRIDGG